MPRIERLGVWLDGQHIADLERRHWNELRCRYTDEALGRWPSNSPVISCALPLQAKPRDAATFCRGLLPEGQALQALATQARLPTYDTFGLLRRYGRDVAGALVISEDEPDPRTFGVEAYGDNGLVGAVDALDEFPLGVHDDSELSLAGLQDKLLLVALDDGGWGRPLRGRPSTHILKRDDPRHPGLVTAEADGLALAAAAGLTTIERTVLDVGGTPCLVVSRFDRRTTRAGVTRVHQEDLCQATATDPDGQRGRAKYERAGGPGFRDAAALLDAHAANPGRELDRLVAVMTFTVLIGNADAHGKNLALLHPDAQTVTLAPLYDTVPTVLWPKLRAEAAMAVNGRSALSAITLDDILAEASTWNHPVHRARASALGTITAVVEALESGALAEPSPVRPVVLARAEQLLA